MCEIGSLEAEHSEHGDVQDGVTLDIAFCSSLHFTPLLLGILAQYKWCWQGFLPPPEVRKVELEFPCGPDPPNGYQTALNGCRTYGFIRLRTLNSGLVVFFPSLRFYRIIPPRRSAPKQGDNVMAQLPMTYPWPVNTHLIYRWLATSLRSLVILFPLYYSTLLTSAFSTVSTDEPS